MRKSPNCLIFFIIFALVLLVNSACTAGCSCVSNVCSFCFPGYIPDGSGTCTTCPQAIPHCISCTNKSVCTACQSNSSLLGTDKLCYECYRISGYGRCATCSSVSCTSCYPSALMENGGCYYCSDKMNYCIACPDLYHCTMCSASGIIQTNQTCKGCWQFIDGCDTCMNETVCITCFAANVSIAEWNDECQFCLVIIPNCLQCTDNITCILCEVKYTVIPNNTCQLCANLIPYCEQCSSPTACTKCISSIIVTLWYSKCAACSEPLSKCLNCISNKTCIKCIDRYFLMSNLCVFCIDYIAYCKNCLDSITCTQCQIGRLVIGGCTLTPGCSSVQQNMASHTSSCIDCYSPEFIFNSLTKVCDCRVGHLAGQYCTQMAGCLVIIKNQNGQVCILADIVNNFYLQNATSICIPYYELASPDATVCTQICGDGYLFTLPCDDGNLINGDGCSDNCQIEMHYVCEGGTKTTPSNCKFKGQIIITDIKSSKILDQNQALIQISIIPYLEIPNLFKMDYINYLTIQIPGKTDISKIQYSDGVIKVYVDYYTDIEGLNAEAFLAFDQSLIRSPSTDKKFVLYSTNIALNFDKNLQKRKMVQRVCRGVAIATCIIFIIASYSHKMIGVQTIMVFQLAFLYQAFAETYDITFVNFKMFNVAFGESGSLFYSSSHLKNDPILGNLNYFVDQYDNIIILSYTKWVIIALFLITQLLLKFKNSKKLLRLKKRKWSSSLKATDKIFKFMLSIKQKIYDFLIFPFFIGFFFVQFTFFVLEIMYYHREPTLVSKIKLILDIILLLLSYIVYFREWIILFQVPSKIENNGIHKANYIPLFLTSIVIIEGLIVISIVLKLKALFLIFNLIFFGFYLIFYCIYRPYKHRLHNFANIYNIITILLVLAFIYIPSASIKMDSQMLTNIFYGVLGVLFGVLILSITRIIIQLRSKCKDLMNKPHKQKDTRHIQGLINDNEGEMAKSLMNLSPYRLQSQQLQQRANYLDYINNQRFKYKMNLLNFDLSLKRISNNSLF